MLVKKILLYISAFIPLYALLLTKIAIELINNNIKFNILNTLMMLFLCIFAILGVIGVVLNIKIKPKTHITITSAVNITEKHFLGYFSLFVLFALTFQIELICMAVVFILILIMIGVVYIKNNLFYINPLLNIIGFSFYSITYKTKNSNEIKNAIVMSYGKLNNNTKVFANITDYNFNIVKR